MDGAPLAEGYPDSWTVTDVALRNEIDPASLAAKLGIDASDFARNIPFSRIEEAVSGARGAERSANSSEVAVSQTMGDLGAVSPEWWPFFTDEEDMSPPLVGEREGPTRSDLKYRKA